MNHKTIVDSPVDVPLFSHKLLSETRPGTELHSVSSFPSTVSAAKDFTKLLQGSDPSLGSDLIGVLTAARNLPIEDLENSLFICDRDYLSVFLGWTFSLVPLLYIHPLVSLYPFQPPKIQVRIETRIKSLVEADPLLVMKYQWTLKMLEFLSKLMGKWGIFSETHFQYRTEVGKLPCLVLSTQLKECSDIKRRLLLPDVVYLAASTVEEDTLLYGKEELMKAGQLSTLVVRTAQFLLTLNQKVDFSSNRNISDYLFTGGRTNRVTPEQSEDHPLTTTRIPNMQKYHYARAIGFHLLDRASGWASCCRKNQTQSQNRVFTNLLSDLGKTYRDFEQLLASHLR